MSRSRDTVVVAVSRKLTRFEAENTNMVLLATDVADVDATLPDNPTDGMEVAVGFASGANTARALASAVPAGCTVNGGANLTLAAVGHSFVLKFHETNPNTGVGNWRIIASHTPA